MDTRLPTKVRAGNSRKQYQQFDYSTPGTDDEMPFVMLPMSLMPTDANHAEPEAPIPASEVSISPTQDLPQLFSDHERVYSRLPQLTESGKELYLLGNSAPLLTNPSLTNILSNCPFCATLAQNFLINQTRLLPVKHSLQVLLVPLRSVERDRSFFQSAKEKNRQPGLQDERENDVAESYRA